MDKITALGEQLSQVTMYDLKSYYSTAKNMVLNIPPYEAKVLEATNSDAWGASSSLMQEIAAGTFNFQNFNEIMPTIYKRFMEKEAREWREIYKALVLLEYLVKNGSERVVDDARAHVSTIKMLRNFHYVDDKGKDQGINVRNRSKEISELLADVEKIRVERRKAKANRSKYIGVGNEGTSFGGSSSGLSGASFQTNTGSRYGGFGSDSLSGSGSGGRGYDEYAGSNQRTAGGSSGGGSRGNGFRDPVTRGGGFEEYDAGDDEEDVSPHPPPARRNGGGISVAAKGREEQKKAAAAPPPSVSKQAPPPPKAVDLFDFGNDDVPPAALPNQASFASAPTLDDDFDDFQSAPSSTPSFSAPPAPNAVPAPAPKAADLFDFFDSTPSQPTPTVVVAAAAAAPVRPPTFLQTPSYTAPPAAAPVFSQQPMKPNYTFQSSFSSAQSAPSSAASKLAAGSGFGGFDDLWSSSLGSMGKTVPVKTASGAGGPVKSMAQMEEEKRKQMLWGNMGGNGASPHPDTFDPPPFQHASHITSSTSDSDFQDIQNSRSYAHTPSTNDLSSRPRNLEYMHQSNLENGQEGYYHNDQWLPSDRSSSYRQPLNERLYGQQTEDGMGLVKGAAPFGRDAGADGWQYGLREGPKGSSYEMDYAEGPQLLTEDRSQDVYDKLSTKDKILESLGIGFSRYSLEQRIENRRRGIGRQRRAWVCYLLSLVMIALMAYTLVKNKNLTGSVIAIKPTFNWMRARFVPCMKNLTDVPLTYPVACFNETRTSVPVSEACTVADYCGLRITDVPNQTWRFFVPIFLHAGIIHVSLNLLVLLSAGAQIEKDLGSLAFSIVFFAGAIFGFEFGGSFSLPAIPSVGASGGIFAVNAVTVVDLFLHWKIESKPKTKLAFLIIEFVIMVGMGYIPYLIDNFSHLGGFMMGLLWGMILYPAISPTRKHLIIVWVLRVISAVLIVLAFVLITRNFFKADSAASCEWCRYLSCLPVKATDYTYEIDSFFISVQGNGSIDDNYNLFELSKTIRALKDISIPMLYSQIAFFHFEEDGHVQMEKLNNTLQKNPELGTLIHSVQWASDSGKFTWPASRLLHNLHNLPNLQFITFDNFLPDTPPPSRPELRPKLRALSIPAFEAFVPKPDIRKWFDLSKLCRLTFSCLTFHDYTSSVLLYLPDTVEDLRFFGVDYRRQESLLLMTLAKVGPRLKTLHLYPNDSRPDYSPEVFRMCPNLTELLLRTSDPTLPYLPPCPKLKVLILELAVPSIFTSLLAGSRDKVITTCKHVANLVRRGDDGLGSLQWLGLYLLSFKIEENRKSPVVMYAGSVLAKVGVKLMDGYGTAFEESWFSAGQSNGQIAWSDEDLLDDIGVLDASDLDGIDFGDYSDLNGSEFSIDNQVAGDGSQGDGTEIGDDDTDLEDFPTLSTGGASS
ncbi:Equilibrative nucleoside transporter protein [Phaffia rhodozyma]|uniref:Equilibrative nucleoside transporter protein n=1 Tax=Phaffia rhodozyma TaxID=264483 RepID=A0A0F7SSF7_PHARH|nr:Equilibrative nucleoside transporter protein [Phaffia rhodozyma]